MQVVVDAHAQVVRDPLADALGVVVVDVARDRADRRDQDRGEPGEQREPHLVLSPPASRAPSSSQCGNGWLPTTLSMIDLDRPRRREAHRRLHHHRGEHDHQPAPIRPYQVEDEARHAGALRS